MKKKILTGLVALLLTSSVFAGGGGGSGTATDIGGGTLASKLNLEWCQSEAALLKNVKMKAKVKLITSSYEATNNLLISGMEQALTKGGAPLSYTRKALLRGLELTEALKNSTLSESERSPIVLYHFLSNYYEFILNESVALDKFFFTSDYFKTGKMVEIEQLEARVIKFSKQQLHFIKANLITTTTIAGYTEVVPVGEAALYLQAVRIFTRHIAEDLLNSLWSTRYMMVAEQLDYLSSSLDEYLAGNLEIFSDDRLAVNLIAAELDGLKL